MNYVLRKYMFCLMGLILIISSCNKSTNHNSQVKAVSIADTSIDSKLPIKSFNYEETNLTTFLNQLYSNHKSDYIYIHKPKFSKFCIEFDVDSTNQHNQDLFYKIHFYHRLFTCNGVSDGNMEGGILRIPYFIHWVEPNPRHSIKSIPLDKYLTEIAPEERFNKYNSFADIDRLPSLYLADLITETPQYYHEICGGFYTFGWCSEREMAFVLLIEEIINMPATVIVSGAHSWTEISATFVNSEGNEKDILVKVDNTFDDIVYNPIVHENTINNYSNWYNRMAHSKGEIDKVNQLNVSNEVSNRIENQVVEYLKLLLND